MSETAKPAPGQPRVEITEIIGFTKRALVSVGVPGEDASQVAVLMAEADARGGDAHGVFRLPQYVKQIQSGGINARPTIRMVSERAGMEVLLSTNPIAIAVPGLYRRSIVLDMATTNTAFGKIRLKAQRNEPMPEGWMIDRQGQPLTDPKRASEGFLVPVGGPKGYGLALMFGLLAGTLNGAAFGRDVVDYTVDSKTPSNTGQAVVALNIAAFADVQAFKQKVDEVWDVMKSSPTLPGVDEVRLPGERSERLFRERTMHGVPLA